VLPTAAPVDSRSNADIEVLVVDDSTVNRKLLVRYVRRIFPSSVISEAVDGVEAVEKVKQRRFDVILMDLFMPNKDGVQATADIRKLFRNGVLLSKPPGIVVVTANAVVEELEKAKAAGADSILQKPLELEQLKLEMLSMMSKAQCAA
jgi:CheY-like chemotaxis protein